MPTESELIAKAKTGDREALAEIVATCWHPVYRLISYKTGCPDEAQELTQETFFRAFRSFSDYHQAETRFTTYLGRIALNLITDFWRKRGRSPAFTDITEHQHLADGGPDPGEQLVQKETRQNLQDALSELPDDQRQVVELRIIAGLPVREAAAAMDKTEAAVKMLQQRALKNLRQKLLDRGALEER